MAAAIILFVVIVSLSRINAPRKVVDYVAGQALPSINPQQILNTFTPDSGLHVKSNGGGFDAGSSPSPSPYSMDFGFSPFGGQDISNCEWANMGSGKSFLDCLDNMGS
jgi:hypothetical protein